MVWNFNSKITVHRNGITIYNFLEGTDLSKYLGLHLDRKLSREVHIDFVCDKIAFGNFVIRNLAKPCPLDDFKKAYYGLLYPHVSYSARSWGGWIGCVKSNLESSNYKRKTVASF